MSPAANASSSEPISENGRAMIDFGGSVAGLLQKSMERFAEIQKQGIDAAVQHSAEMADILKKTAEKVPGAPRPAAFDLAAGTVARCADTQKLAINFVVEQSKAWTGILKERSQTAKEVADSCSHSIKQGLEQSNAMNKKVLESTAAGAKAMMDAARDHFGLREAQTEAVSDSFKQGIDNVVKGFDSVVDAQKEFIDVVAH